MILLFTCPSNRADPSRCLDAFIIALNQATHGKGWCASPKQLQLASLEFCMACRSVPTLSVSVEKDTPTRLWADAPGRETHSAKRLSSTRVPVVQAHRVTWTLPASALRRMGDVLSKAECFNFDGDLDGDVRGVDWPASLQHLYFFRVNTPLAGVSWPPSLQTLIFSILVNEPISEISWPASLKRLRLGLGFNQPVIGVSIPRA